MVSIDWQQEPWIGVDFDGTLAVYEGTLYEAGPPIPAMVERVKQWHAEGKRVKIMTARVAANGTFGKDGFGGTPNYAAEQEKLIRWWCLKHLGFELEVTCMKDFKMIALYDDCAIQVERGTGRIIGEADRRFTAQEKEDHADFCRRRDEDDGPCPHEVM